MALSSVWVDEFDAAAGTGLDATRWTVIDAKHALFSLGHTGTALRYGTIASYADTLILQSTVQLTSELFELSLDFSRSVLNAVTDIAVGLGIVKADGTNLYGIRFYKSSTANRIQNAVGVWTTSTQTFTINSTINPVKIYLRKTGATTWLVGYWNGSSWYTLAAYTRDLGPPPYYVRLYAYRGASYPTVNIDFNTLTMISGAASGSIFPSNFDATKGLFLI